MTNKFKTAKDGFVNAIDPKKDLKNLYILLVGISAAVFFLLCLIFGNAQNTAIFFDHGADFFMDCFNQIRDCAQGKEVYSERHVIYPPMANLIFLILSRFTSNTYNDTDFGMRYSWKMYGSSMILMMLVLAVCVVAMFALIFKATKRGSVNHRLIFAAMATLSVPLLYMMERGNMLILCVMSLLIYAFSYNSESKVAREIGLIALAFAFSLKLYPAVFGWFLIADKRYKEAIRCVLYGIAMLILPSFFFGGPIFVVQTLYENITRWSSGSGNDLVQAMKALHFTDLQQSAVNLLIYVWVLIGGLCFAISPFIRPDQSWKTWTVGALTILCVPSLTGVYTWAFLLIPLIMLADREATTKKNVTYVALMTVPFMFLPLGWISLESLLESLFPFLDAPNISLAKIWIYVITAVFSIFAVTDTLLDLKKFLADRKVKKEIAE